LNKPLQVQDLNTTLFYFQANNKQTFY
jgi:hypothetical protein